MRTLYHLLLNYRIKDAVIKMNYDSLVICTWLISHDIIMKTSVYIRLISGARLNSVRRQNHIRSWRDLILKIKSWLREIVLDLAKAIYALLKHFRLSNDSTYFTKKWGMTNHIPLYLFHRRVKNRVVKINTQGIR